MKKKRKRKKEKFSKGQSNNQDGYFLSNELMEVVIKNHCHIALNVFDIERYQAEWTGPKEYLLKDTIERVIKTKNITYKENITCLIGLYNTASFISRKAHYSNLKSLMNVIISLVCCLPAVQKKINELNHIFKIIKQKENGDGSAHGTENDFFNSLN